MALLDDNNDHLYTQGDPLDELDRELAELKAALGEAESELPEQPTAAETPDQPAPIQQKTEEDMKPKNKKKTDSSNSHRAPLVIAAIALSAALVIGVGFLTARLLARQPEEADETPTSAGEMVTISDSVMGDIELQTVEGAALNTYTADNLEYDENGYPVYYEKGEKISHLGADLSEYQGEVDFEALQQAGVEFVMLRVGGRYYGDDGGLYEDKSFESFYEQAKEAGLKVGAYFFSQAISAADAKEEAQYTLDKLEGKELDYPIAFDWENIADDEARTDDVTGDMLTTLAGTFCDTISAEGYRSIVYSNTQQMFIMYDFETMKDYDFWLADYRDFPTMYYKFDMWQYSMDGTIDGVEGTVDLNLSFTDFT